MNLNTLQHALKTQLNQAISIDKLTVEEASEIINGELANLVARASILEIIPFPDSIKGISLDEMKMYIEHYQNMMECWAGKVDDIFKIVSTLEVLRFDEANTEIKLITKLVDLASTVDLETRGVFGELSAAFHGDREGKWVRAIRNVKADVAHAQKRSECGSNDLLTIS